jgi:uncharacterized protein
LHSPFDLFIFLAVIIVQWRLTRRFLATAKARLSPSAARKAIWAAAAFNGLMLAAFALSFSFLISRFHLPSNATQIAGGVAQIWFFASTAGYVAYAAFHFLTRQVRRRSFSPARRQLLNATGGALLAAPFAFVGYGTFVERLHFAVREVVIPIANLPVALDGLRLLHLSDIHLSAFLSEQDLARVIDASNELHPHLALVTGDLITAFGDPLDTCLRQVARLRADAGILGCMGNHEHYALAETYAQREGARLGVRFLRDAATPLRFGDGVLNVAGVDYQRSGQPYLPGAERLVLPGACNLLLSHNPDVFPVALQKGYDVMLAGHTHGGQVTVEIFNQSINPARFVTPYVYGLYSQDSALAFVTRGIGTIGIPTRIGAPPEIALLHLRKA